MSVLYIWPPCGGTVGPRWQLCSSVRPWLVSPSYPAWDQRNPVFVSLPRFPHTCPVHRSHTKRDIFLSLKLCRTSLESSFTTNPSLLKSMFYWEVSWSSWIDLDISSGIIDVLITSGSNARIQCTCMCVLRPHGMLIKETKELKIDYFANSKQMHTSR